MTQTLAIAQNTIREAIRNRIFASLIFFTLAMLGITMALSSASLNEEIRLMKDVGLFLVSTASVFIAIFTGVNLVYKELERKTIYTIMPKPIYRWQFLVGKYLGLAGTMAFLVAFMGLVLFGLLFIVGGEPGWAMLQAVWLLYVEVLIVLSVAMIFSSFSTPFLSGLMTLGVFIVGRFVDVLSTIQLGEPDERTATTEAVSTLIQWIVRIAPDLSLYNLTPQLVYDRPISGEFILQTTVLGLTYILISLAISAFLFSRRDFV